MQPHAGGEDPSICTPAAGAHSGNRAALRDRYDVGRLRSRYPDADVHFFAPLMQESLSVGVVPHYAVGAADMILAVDADFLASMPFHLRYAREFADRRRIDRAHAEMNRLYVVESGVT